jgi:hypothetical protein
MAFGGKAFGEAIDPFGGAGVLTLTRVSLGAGVGFIGLAEHVARLTERFCGRSSRLDRG